MWDGTAEQVRTRWRLGKGVTMPLLLNASRMASDYGQSYQTFTIIDHEGLIRFKTSYLIPMDELRDEVLLALADIPPIEEEVEEPVETEETVETIETVEAEETVETVETEETVETIETVEPADIQNMFDLFYTEAEEMVETEETEEMEETEETVVTAVVTFDQASVPQAFSLAQNAPNPFNGETLIRFALPQSSQVELTIYNLLGQPVAVLVQGPSAAGTFSVRWDGRDQTGRAVTSGVYLYQLRAGDYTEVRKLLLIR
ncbi:MAG: T9SS type A sorting domain-containing protein [Gemmatimonadetes bacterium]|nr:T9SS type A sorting domain-containing protein [Gemmatimonadota bacterium]